MTPLEPRGRGPLAIISLQNLLPTPAICLTILFLTHCLILPFANAENSASRSSGASRRTSVPKVEGPKFQGILSSSSSEELQLNVPSRVRLSSKVSIFDSNKQPAAAFLQAQSHQNFSSQFSDNQHRIVARQQPQPGVFGLDFPGDPVFSWPQAQITGDVCALPEVIGTGPYRIPRWYFNPATQKCELFYYSGCCGNGNNFPTFEGCQVLCEVDVCTQPRDLGRGSLQISRYYFNMDSKKCTQFIYLGTGGNRNNFATLAECRAKCPESPNPCAFGEPMKTASETPMQCSVVATASSCPLSYYCHVGSSQSTTLCCPVGPGDKCSQPVREGSGDESLSRWAFNFVSQECRQFSYKGLQGNQNNFLLKAECDNSCFANPCSVGVAYRQGTQILQCSANNQQVCPARYYCHIGADTRSTVCCPSQGEPCSQPRLVGNGNANLERWYLDPQSRVCRPFSYTGKGGNQNNFISEEECKKVCKVFINACVRNQPAMAPSGFPVTCTAEAGCPPGFWCHVGSTDETTMCCPGAQASPCLASPSRGEGRENLARWHYDPQSRRCSEFSYTGIGGTQNNFRSKDECLEYCPEFSNPCPQGEPPTQLGPGGLPFPFSCAGELGHPIPESCPRNTWCHVGSSSETTYCCPGAQDPCGLTLAMGFGNEQLPRWAFDVNSRQCHPFTYAGQKGNQNNFLTKEDCEKQCPVFQSPCLAGETARDFSGRPIQCNAVVEGSCSIGYYCHVGATAETTVCCPSVGDACKLPRVDGEGAGSLPRYYFKPDIRQCLPFLYKGTKGNDNNFLTEEACALRCPVFLDPCPGGSSSSVPGGSLSFNIPISCARQGSCPNGFWCHVGATEDSTVCCKGGEDRCNLPLATGSGSGNLPRFYYNQIARQCVAFTYRGMYGNANSFLTKEQCEKVCPVFTSPCAIGDPILRSDGRPQTCSADGFRCSLGYYCHVGASQSSTVCCRTSVADPCFAPVSEGIGTNALPRWNFDPSSRSCRQFTYRGSKGNENNFHTSQDCEKACPVFENPCPSGQPLLGPAERPSACDMNSCLGNYWCHYGADTGSTACCPGRQDPCQLPVAQGTGNSVLPRWFFDSSTRSCRSFTYSGLKGNQNNFLSKQDCEKQCPVFTNPCPSPLVSPNIAYCSAVSPSCPSGHWCHFGADRDSTLCCPLAGDPCTQKMERGSNSASLPRWFYDSGSKECRSFTYSGAMGNQNNFLSRQDCEAACPVFVNPCPDGPLGDSLQSKPQFCGPSNFCGASFWCHFGSNADTTVCCPMQGDSCSQPQNQGTGPSNLPRWFFNSLTLQCEQFNYRGLKGNQNNFVTKQDCELQCPVFQNPCPTGEPPRMPGGRAQQCSRNSGCQSGFWCHIGASVDTTVCCPAAGDPCNQNQASGTGTSQLPRWFYHPNTRQCMQFSYRGLKGNQNNFLTRAECTQQCEGVNPCANGEAAVGRNGRPQECVPFASSCNENFYCHVGATAESTVCCPGRMEDACQMPLQQGTGSASLPRWFFNPLSRQCETFNYRGLRGNPNNFLTKEQCEQVCPAFENPCASGEPLVDNAGRPVLCALGSNVCGSGYWCHLGASSDTTVCCPGVLESACSGLQNSEGLGSLMLPRWFYDLSSRQCRQFTYRGTKGNPNNFLSLEDCEKTCPVFQNPCIQPIQFAVYCSTSNSLCRPGQWCHFGYDRESTVCCPGAVDSQQICSLPVLFGNGNASLSRYYFNSQTRQCISFTYRGTKGNQNNFFTQQECERLCPIFKNPCNTGFPLTNPSGRPQTCSATGQNSCLAGYWCHVGDSAETTVCCPGSGANACELPPIAGEGTANLPRWYYNPASQRCQQFSYAGLKGNQNNFLSQEQCQSACRRAENPCSGPPATQLGQFIFCSASNKGDCPVNYWCHVGYSPETTLCCPGATNPCSVPLAPGTGNANLQRFYYNADSRQCVPFTYNGIGGNQNNFLTRAECEVTCPVWTNPCSNGLPAQDELSGRPHMCDPHSENSCPPSHWCHIGISLDETVCCPGPKKPIGFQFSERYDVCILPRHEGTGKASVFRWYFDAAARKCLQFTYSGYGGNQNNFLTREDCLGTCSEFDNPCLDGEPEKDELGIPKACYPFLPMSCGYGYYCHVGGPPDGKNESTSNYCCPATDDVCGSQALAGEGPHQLQRFFYSSRDNDCQSFIYRGKKGNMNNFLSKEECLKQCLPDRNPCSPPDQPLNIRQRNLACRREDPSSCPPTHYCHIGSDAYATACCPRRGNPCEQRLAPGSGPQRLQRWYYHKEDDGCLPFPYRGSAGNENNFLSKEECEFTCPGFRGFCPHGKPLLTGEIPAQCGVETACPSSNYVCHINTEKSASVCCPDPAGFCVLPRDPGPCRNFATRYGYNRDTGTCTPFQFGGCGGNLNNFVSLEQCTTVCCNKGF